MSGFSDILISRCTTHDNGDAGIASWAGVLETSVGYAHHDITIEWSKAFHNRGVKNKGNHSGDGIVIGCAERIVIEHCIAYENGELNDYDGGGPVGIWVWESAYATIQHCESYGNRSQTIDGGGFDEADLVTYTVLCTICVLLKPL